MPPNLMPLARIGSATRCAFEDAAAFELRRDTEHRKDKLGKIRSRIDNRLGNRAQAHAGALHVAGDHQKVGRVARQPVNGGGDDNVAGREGFHQLLKLRPVGGGAGDLLAEHLFASSRLELSKLAGEVLGVGRDSCITVNHTFILHRNF